MQVERWFKVLVVESALLAGCEEENAPRDSGTNPQDSGSEADSGGGDTTGGACADVCENTDQWTECLADGVMCCWAAGDCCDPCCGHLSP